MAAKPGRNVVLKVSNGASPPSYVTVGGARSHNVKKMDGALDVTDKDSGGYFEEEYGLAPARIEISHAGLYKGTAGELLLMAHIEESPLTKVPISMQMVEPGRGSYTFLAVVERDMTAPHDGAKENTYAIRSSGPVAFVAESPQS